MTASLADTSTRRGGHRAAAAFLDPDLDGRGLDLIRWNGTRSHRLILPAGHQSKEVLQDHQSHEHDEKPGP